jgi:hypothetical protein
MTDYTIISKFRNYAQCDRLIAELKKRGKTCYDFCANPVDPEKADFEIEEQMKAFEKTDDFWNDPNIRKTFERDLDGLKNAEKVIMLLPAGHSAHIEAGIAYGLGKPLILVGETEKADTLYLIFQERYETMEKFLESIS